MDEEKNDENASSGSQSHEIEDDRSSSPEDISASTYPFTYGDMGFHGHLHPLDQYTLHMMASGMQQAENSGRPFFLSLTNGMNMSTLLSPLGLQHPFNLSTSYGSAQAPAAPTPQASKPQAKPKKQSSAKAETPRRGRNSFSADQIAQLEEHYKVSQYLTANRRKQLAEDLELQDLQVKTWFQNRRTKTRREMRAGGLLPCGSRIKVELFGGGERDQGRDCPEPFSGSYVQGNISKLFRGIEKFVY
ncbi:unnamed protein product [Caenorhabditis auriculariae]|uniref:Homeobox domain-containing protein n=1 Tax=Caenorhabditis auriculariae TaxID=2777116 RepID=A0A8S1GVQ7_9PELO|nr:unnamed protein product [Caenorhabditis auriculariae]